MKKLLALIPIIFLCVAAGPVSASSTLVVDAGKLTAPASAPMQADNASPSNDGSLLLLIDLGSSNAINNALTTGNYVAGTNTILAAGGFNNNAGTGETLTVFVTQGTPNPGDLIALRWFPQITYAQYRSGAIPAPGNYFGTYNPNGGNPDGGSTWVVPADGSTIDLDFFTSDSDLGGSQPPSFGFAGLQVTASGTTPFSSWQSTYFNAQQLNDPSISGPNATPLGDGVPNLLKYLYDMNPVAPMTASDRAALPSVQVTGNGSFFTLTYRESSTATGITVTAQSSSDLQNWSAVSSQQVSTDPTTGDFIMQAQVPLSGTRQFLRLRVTSP